MYTPSGLDRLSSYSSATTGRDNAVRLKQRFSITMRCRVVFTACPFYAFRFTLLLQAIFILLDFIILPLNLLNLIELSAATFKPDESPL